MFANKRNDIDAKVVNNTLVVSFLGTDQPRVWRGDMGGLASATLELRDDKTSFSVVLRRTGAAAPADETIATFKDRESATDTLRIVTNAMMRGDGTTLVTTASGTVVAAAAPTSGSFFGGLVKTLLVVAIVIGLVGFVIMHLFTAPDLSASGGRITLPSAAKAGAAAAGGAKKGEPVSADSFFK
ncbi:MAG: hypothetical protein PW788_04800 [Micavibrio sp.]|nr:hypothetical protein [Micavibrio sp.]